MASDVARQRIVLFGGWDGQSNLGDTWEWDGSLWSRLSTSGPSARSNHSMAYDEVRQRIVLFGGLGRGFNYLGDTWEWDGANWSLISQMGPSARAGSAMEWDPNTAQVVLYAGWSRSPTGAPTYYRETWGWDGARWTRLQPPTTPGLFNSACSRDCIPDRLDMSLDRQRSRIVLADQRGRGAGQATWEWNGVDWTPFSSGTTVAFMASVYDANRQRVVLTAGGYSDEWDGSSWLNLQAASPDAAGMAVEYDWAGGRPIRFGGVQPALGGQLVNATEEGVSRSPATFAMYGTGCPGSLGNPTLDAAIGSLPWTGDAFSLEFGNLPAGSFPFMALGFNRTSIPVPGLPGCIQLVSVNAIDPLALNGNVANWTRSVPVSAGLVGWSLFFQGAAFNAGSGSPFGPALSNGGRATVGMR